MDQLRYAVAGSGPAVVMPKKDRGSYVPFERLADQYHGVRLTRPTNSSLQVIR
ncbi:MULTISPECIES: hypothetical protein [Kribbella]|uniref:hypothetical protein n=1 Tax=Kribbella TaxID=182639 RepID=UPI00130530F0|nr:MULTISPECIES: hypothetical protein [Kribbella]